MESMAKEYGRIADHNALLGQDDSINKQYTKLLLILRHRNEEEREHELKQLGRKRLALLNNRTSDEYQPISIQALFDPVEDGHVPETVLLKGPAGIGKTTTVQEIMVKWSSGNMYQDKFKYVFCISCREINNITAKMSLCGFISNVCEVKCSENEMESILGDSKNILVIIDGVDELRWQFQKTTDLCVDPMQKASIEIILNSLLRKKILPRASLLITTRPYTLGRLQECVQSPRYVEVLGFNEKNRESYFYNFFQNKEQAERAVEIIKENETLFTMCVVPITCWIVCTTMRRQMERGLNVANTTTSVYWLYVESLMTYDGRGSDLNCVKKLCALAKDGIMEQRIQFDENDIKDHGLTVSELDSTFLNKNIFQRTNRPYTTYSFIHLSVQEFFAALYYVLVEDTDRSDRSEGSNMEVMDLLENSLENKHLTLTVRFLFGLCGDEQKKEIEVIFGCEILTRIKSTLETWLRERIQPVTNKYFLAYLYEIQDKDLVGRMMSQCKELDTYNDDHRILTYCLMNSPRHDHRVVLAGMNLSRKSLQILSKGFMNCAKVSLNGCYLTSSYCENLKEIIITNRSLISLDLSWNKLGDSGVKLLCDGLKHPDCTLQELRLGYCFLTSSCCEDLQDVITTNRSLIRLDLIGNKLGDSGVRLLCDGLRHPDCTLQELGGIPIDL
ncbi:NACHT, LRR and PYD domains-containing protein 3-like [Discoglossus pictus]